MKPQIKTTFYDILGYLLPGGVSISLFWVASRHFAQETNVLSSFSELLSSYGLSIYIVILCFSYILGHAFSALGSLIFGLISRHIKKLKTYFSVEDILESTLYIIFKNKLKEVFGVEPNGNTLRLCVNYVEANQPEIYSTAFIFLSIYGMSRSFAFLFFLFTLAEAVNCVFQGNKESIMYLIAGLVLSILFAVQYVRFKRYFSEYILLGFIQKERA